MRMMDELKHLFLYSSKKKVYVPIDEMDKRKNSAVLLLSPNTETSIQLTKMPYLYNPNLFKSYYIDRNVDAYIKSVDPEVLDFDEQEEEILSESLFSNDNVKFKIEDGTSYVDRKCIDAVYTKNIVKEYKNLFGLKHLPSEINIKVYPNKGALKKDAPDKVTKFYKDGLYSYSIKGTIHLISKMTYDERRLGPYDKYLLTELITYLICNDNNKIPVHIGKAIGYAFSGLYDWIKNEDNDPDIYIPKSIEEIEGIFAELREMEEYGVIKKFIKTANIRVLGDYYKRSFFKPNKDDMFMEGELSYFERQRLLPSEFGVPGKRKYPMPDKDHVKAAIQMFNKCDPEDEKELADNIIKKIKKFDMADDVHVGASNRFKKYFDKFHESLKETSLLCTDGINESTSKTIYFLSEVNMDQKTLYPRIPDNFLTRNGYEDNTTPRVCFSTSIGKCLTAMSMKLTDKEFYIHCPAEDHDIYSPSIKEVPDVQITGEKWIKEPVKLVCVGKIRVTGPARGKGMDYTYGDGKTATLYNWSFEKLEDLPNHSITETASLLCTTNDTDYVNEISFLGKATIGLKIHPHMELWEILKAHKYPGIYNYAKKSKDIDELLYLRQDAYTGIRTYEKIKKLIETSDEWYKDYDLIENDMLKKLKKHNVTAKDVDLTIKWFKEEYLKLINDKIKELRHNQKMNESYYLESICSESAPIPNDSKYYDILKICDNLSDDEFKRISFYDTYKDSKFVIHRIVRKINDEPVAFLDLYQFPSRPDIAQITLAVDEKHRGLGLADGMVKELLNAGLPEKYGFKTFYWTAHENNKASMGLALKNGFIDTKELDKYGRRVFIRPVSVEDNMWNDVPEDLKPNSEDEYTVTENALVSNNMAFFSEVDGSMYSTNLKRYLYKERLKNNKEVLRLYDDVKAQQPDITKTYVKLEMYRKANVFIDLSYYNSVFLKNLNYKLDRGVNFYFEFMNRLINNPTVTSEYKMRTVFIPIDSGVWGTTDPVTLWDYRKNINPISVIFRLLKSNPSLLKKEFGKNNIIFVGSRGYFKIDFKQLDLRDLNRLKKNITKLMSFSEPIEDEYESDDVANDDTEVSYGKKRNNSDSSKAMAMNMIDKIEKGTSIKLNNVSPISQKDNVESTTDNAKPLSHIHLRVTKEPLQFGLGSNKVYDGSTAIISLDPAGSDNFKKLFDRNGVFKNIKNVNTYCIPK